MGSPLAMRQEAAILRRMLRALRNLVLLAAAIVFTASGVGWGYANASTVLGSGDTAHHRAMAEAQGGHRHEAQQASDGHHHASEAADPCTDKAACGDGHAHVGDASSCCAAACHMAIPTAFHAPLVTLLVLGRQALPPDTDGIQASVMRLDRPPKLSSPQIG
ncbi:hypothetical protein [Roseixanthobacter liquoris]|uniref:hypothetical protein n=1 Tax=Roseixanthobacter liquoris TaxID=3119921 RepID=UPI00372A785A